MKKNYQQPKMQCVLLQQHSHLLDSSLHDTESNVGLKYGGAKGDVNARTKEDSWSEVWDDE